MAIDLQHGIFVVLGSWCLYAVQLCLLLRCWQLLSFCSEQRKRPTINQFISSTIHLCSSWQRRGDEAPSARPTGLTPPFLARITYHHLDMKPSSLTYPKISLEWDR
jgi:hypothetical protein